MDENQLFHNHPPFPDPEGLPVIKRDAIAAGSASPNEGERLSPFTDEETVAVAQKAALRLIANSLETTDVHKEIGHGDRKKIHLEELGEELVLGVFQIQEKYRPLADGDKTQFKLQQALFTIGQMAATNTRSIETVIDMMVPGSKPSREDRFKLMRTHDSLKLLEDAFRHIISDPQTGREEHIKNFLDKNKSPLWDDNEDDDYETKQAKEKIKEAIFKNVDIAYQIIGELSSPNPKSVEAFIKKFRYDLLRKSGITPPPRHGKLAVQQANYDRAVSNLRKQAWLEWRESVPPLHEAPDLGKDASVLPFRSRGNS